MARLLRFKSPGFAALAALCALPMLTGCNMVVLDPAGDVARQQGNLIVTSTLLMLLIIVPVMALTVFFAWRYRAANTEATYKPDWDHSTQLELVIWAAPLLIIICLGALTWVSTHLLDPYRPLARSAPDAPNSITGTEQKPLEVQVVALDWKWLFIYPEQGIATVNEFAAPVDRAVRFRISGSSVMNSFYIPALAGQIYAMAGMETKLHGAFDQTGDFTGFSANYSGAGFSNMRFKARSLSPGDFDNWIAQAKASNAQLDRAAYLALERPSEKNPVQRFATVEDRLFDMIVNLCVEPGKMCMHEMMAIDARGGMGLAGLYNVRELAYDKFTARGSTLLPESKRFVAATCTIDDMPLIPGASAATSLAPLSGIGLSLPGSRPSATAVALNRAPADLPPASLVSIPVEPQS